MWRELVYKRIRRRAKAAIALLWTACLTAAAGLMEAGCGGGQNLAVRWLSEVCTSAYLAVLCLSGILFYSADCILSEAVWIMDEGKKKETEEKEEPAEEAEKQEQGALQTKIKKAGVFETFECGIDRLGIVFLEMGREGQAERKEELVKALFFTVKIQMLQGRRLNQILEGINDRKIRQSAGYENRNLFIWVGILQTGSGELTYCSAGQTEPLCLERDGSVRKLQMLKGEPLRGEPGQRFWQNDIALGEWEALFFSSEQTEGMAEETGMELKELFLKAKRRQENPMDAEMLLEEVKKEIAVLCGKEKEEIGIELLERV